MTAILASPPDEGSTRVAVPDTIDRTLVERFCATMDREPPGAGEPLPSGIHWCLAAAALRPGLLGRDGHPRPGLLLPDTGLPVRRWAGGELVFRSALRMGDEIEVRTSLSNVEFKHGRSGKLAFVSTKYNYRVAGEARIDEMRRLVYRDAEARAAGLVFGDRKDDSWQPVASRNVSADAVLLFRYSALTFNGHRIHYDVDYARNVEHLGGLAVHAPLQATWLLDLATEALGAQPSRFTYRAVAPLLADTPAVLETRNADGGGLDLRVRTTERPLTTLIAYAE